MSFWTAEDKVPIAQTKVSIPAEHGLQYSPGQKCEFHIPAGIGFFQPKESYLNLSVKLSSDGLTPTRLQLDAESGLQILIKEVRIYSKGSGRILLEEYQNYNVLTALKYDYETNDTLRAKRSLTEGTTNYTEKTRSTTAMPKSAQNNLNENPYYKPLPKQTAVYDTAWSDDDDFLEVKALLPLHTGIFQNSKVFPIAMTEGLIVELIFEDARRVFRTLDQTSSGRHLSANPFFHSTNGSNHAPDEPVADNASQFEEFYVRRDNCQGWDSDISSFPFVVGEEIGFMDSTDGSELLDTKVVAGNKHITEISYVAGTENLIKVKLNGSFRPTTDTLTQKFVLFSKSIENSATYAPTYTITNSEFVIQKVTMPQGYTSKLASMMKGGGAMNYDFVSATNYKISQQASERVANLRLPLTQSRAKAILCIPTDASASGTKDLLLASGTYESDYDMDADGITRIHDVNHSQRTGITGCADFLTSYQLFYDGKLNPNRKVSTSKISNKTSVDAQPLIELEKALVMSGIKPFSMLKFRENFCIGRALSLQNGVYDARGKDFALQLEYQETDAPDIDKLWHCWCVHLRRIVISGSAISLQV